MAYHHGNLRAALLERAVEVIDERGVDALSMRGLARDLGVSHGASMRHFADRRALLDAVAVAGFARMGAHMRERAPAADLPLRETLGELSRAYAGFATSHPNLIRLMHDIARGDGASDELLAASVGALEPIDAFIRRGHAEGVLRDGPAGDLALAVFAPVHGVAELSTTSLLRGAGVDAAVDVVVDVVWRGLLADRDH